MRRRQLFEDITFRTGCYGALTMPLVAVAYAVLGLGWPTTVNTASTVGESILISVLIFLGLGWWAGLLGGIASLMIGLAAATVTVVFFYPLRERWPYTLSMLLVAEVIAYFYLRVLFGYLRNVNPAVAPHDTAFTVTVLLAVAVLTLRHSNTLWAQVGAESVTAKRKVHPMSNSDDAADTPAASADATAHQTRR